MQFLLTLHVAGGQHVIPVNYQYPLSAAIYRILESADSDYAAFLHNTGYRQAGSLKSFKLFTFSDIKTAFRLNGDRMHLLAPQAQLLVSFHLPLAAEKFIRGIFLNQQLEIADRKSKTVFTISQVAALSHAITEKQSVLLQPISPLVCGKKNDKDQYEFLSPEHPEFLPQLLYNWKEKYNTVYGAAAAEVEFKGVKMEVIFFTNPPKSRLITIKANTIAETKIRGFVNFRLKPTAGKQAVELLLDAGAGLYNSLGMGCLEVIRN